MGMKRGDTRINAGFFDQPANFYVLAEGRDSAGGMVKTPIVHNGLIVGTPTPAYWDFVAVQPYQGSELTDAERIVGETWSIISVRYHRTRLPRESMLIQIKLNGETYEIRSVTHVDFSRKKVEMICRLLR